MGSKAAHFSLKVWVVWLCCVSKSLKSCHVRMYIHVITYPGYTVWSNGSSKKVTLV